MLKRKHFGVVRYPPSHMKPPTRHYAAFDGWYTHREDATSVCNAWCKTYPGWIVAMVYSTDIRFPGE